MLTSFLPRKSISPRAKARITGLFYLLEIVAGGLGVMVAKRLFVSGNATLTAHNIIAHQSFFLFGFAANLLQFAAYIVVTGLLYELLKPVNQTVSLLAALLSTLGCAVGALATVTELAPLTVLGGGAWLNVFSAAQLSAMAMLFIKLFGAFFNASFVFFGFYCLLIGYLIIRSGFLPRVIGSGMMIAGLGWLTFLWPPLALALSPYILLVGLGELALTVWLIASGVNSARWLEANARAIAEAPRDTA